MRASLVRDSDGLTKQQRALVLHVEEGMSVVAAYRAAYPNSRANYQSVWRNANYTLKRPKVAAFREALRARALERHDATVDRVVAELCAIAFANMADYVTVRDGHAGVNLAPLTRAQAAAIAELRTVETRIGRGDAARDVIRVTFRLHDKIAALEKLGRHLGIFRDRVEVTGKNGAAIGIDDVTPMERARRIAFILARARKGDAN